MSNAPRMFWNPANGEAEMVMATPPPSQLISRRPLSSGPGLLALLGSPKAARKVSTVDWIDAVVLFPPTENSIATAPPSLGTTKETQGVQSHHIENTGSNLSLSFLSPRC